MPFFDSVQSSTLVSVQNRVKDVTPIFLALEIHCHLGGNSHKFNWLLRQDSTSLVILALSGLSIHSCILRNVATFSYVFVVDHRREGARSLIDFAILELHGIATAELIYSTWHPVMLVSSP
jgi:hypothetical protein